MEASHITMQFPRQLIVTRPYTLVVTAMAENGSDD